MSAVAALKDHLILAAASALLLGGGTQVLSNKVDIARQDERLARVEKMADALHDIRKDLRTTREAVIRIEARQEAEDESSQRKRA